MTRIALYNLAYLKVTDISQNVELLTYLKDKAKAIETNGYVEAGFMEGIATYYHTSRNIKYSTSEVATFPFYEGRGGGHSVVMNSLLNFKVMDPWNNPNRDREYGGGYGNNWTIGPYNFHHTYIFPYYDFDFDY